MTLDPAAMPAGEAAAARPDGPDGPAQAGRTDDDVLAALLEDGAFTSSDESDAGEGSAAADTGSLDGAGRPADAAFEDTLFDAADTTPAAAPAESAFDDILFEDVDAAPAAGVARADTPEDPHPTADDALFEDVEAVTADNLLQTDAAADIVPGDTHAEGIDDAAAASDGSDEAADRDLAFEDILLEDIDAAPAASSDQAGESADTSLISGEAHLDNIDAASDTALLGSDAPAPGTDTDFRDALLEDTADSPADTTEGAYADAQLDAIPIDPAAALAFATDANTEVALRDGLFGFEGSSPDCSEAQVWQGDIRAAIGAISAGQSADLIFVDIDGIRYPAGAIYELSAVCELGTVVIAVGSDATARPGRELLLAGVSDYLAKPLTADAVRKAAERALLAGADDGPSGCAAGFVGTGGSGATTLTAAVAIHAAARGCYVSVLDLNRSVASAAFSLGVEPAAGLDQLLEAAERSTPEPEMVDGVRVRRSERIEVYAHRWSPTQPPAPPVEALDRLIGVLKHRSKLVLIDGFELPALGFVLPPALDMRVLVSEPTAGRATHTARIMQMVGADNPMLFVQNHTRAFKSKAGARNFLNAGIESEPDVVFPFESTLPDFADRGWPEGRRLPRPLRDPLTTLTDRILGSFGDDGRAPLQPPRES